MTKRSPGPWRIGVLRMGHKTDIVDAEGENVAEVWYGEGQANLRLILKAPELLAVVRKLTYGAGARCPTLLKAQALLNEIDGKEKPMAERKHEFVWQETPDHPPRHSDAETLWCAEEYTPRVRAVKGVARVWQSVLEPKCIITFDPRYDRDEVRAEIEAIITGG